MDMVAVGKRIVKVLAVYLIQLIGLSWGKKKLQLSNLIAFTEHVSKYWY